MGMANTFFGGVHPNPLKITQKRKIHVVDTPKKIIIPMQQHIGKPAKPIVLVGDIVKKYQKIADSDGFVSVPYHSPVYGKVTAIEETDYAGGRCQAIHIDVIDSDDLDSSENLTGVTDLAPEQIITAVKNAGIVGMGGAAFPTHVKLSVPEGKSAEVLIINGCECEPYITSDHRVMLEYADEIISGIEIIMKATNVRKAIIGIEDNKKDAYIIISKKLKNYNKNIEVKLVKTKYPQGAEKLLIKAVLDRAVPAGALPIDIGVIVNNVATCKAVHDAVIEGRPLVERVVTVTGDVKKPGNYLVPIGVSYGDLLESAIGAKGKTQKMITGGPMMGISQDSFDVQVMKGTNCVVFWSDPLSLDEYIHCIRCGACISVCPYHLMPTEIAKYAQQGLYAVCGDNYAMDCMECGCCTYVCPSKIPLVQFIRLAKDNIRKNNEKNKINEKNK
jgi:Na+-translocating ferredoxin:NAD+ oxidoreductase subunit C